MSKNDEVIARANLLRTRAVIEQVLREADLCATVVLVGPRGQSEIFAELGASWSRARMEPLPEGGAYMRLRSQLADYGGDVARQKADLEDTVGMIATFGQVLGEHAIVWLEASKHFDAATDAEHTGLEKG